MLAVFYKKFYRQKYADLSKLDQYIKKTFKKVFITKKIYIDISDDYINQYLANLIINK